jgi:hypothetical protein
VARRLRDALGRLPLGEGPARPEHLRSDAETETALAAALPARARVRWAGWGHVAVDGGETDLEAAALCVAGRHLYWEHQDADRPGGSLDLRTIESVLVEKRRHLVHLPPSAVVAWVADLDTLLPVLDRARRRPGPDTDPDQDGGRG